MSRISELESGEVEFVDGELDEVLASVSDGERVEMLLRPVCSRDEFVSVAVESDFGAECEPLGYESVRIDLTRDECELLLAEEVVEALEVNRPVRLIE